MANNNENSPHKEELVKVDAEKEVIESSATQSESSKSGAKQKKSSGDVIYKKMKLLRLFRDIWIQPYRMRQTDCKEVNGIEMNQLRVVTASMFLNVSPCQCLWCCSFCILINCSAFDTCCSIFVFLSRPICLSASDSTQSARSAHLKV